MPKQSAALDRLDPDLRQAVLQRYAWEQRRRWFVLAILWLVGVPLCLWLLRYHLGLLQEVFTWAALRYGLIFNPKPAIALLATLLLSATSLISWGVHRHFGLSRAEVKRLEKQVRRIQTRGKQHPL